MEQLVLEDGSIVNIEQPLSQPQINNEIKYIILSVESINNLNFDQVLETNVNTLRFSADKTKTFVKYINSAPDIISDAIEVNGRTIHTHSQILEILNSPEWITNIEEGI